MQRAAIAALLILPLIQPASAGAQCADPSQTLATRLEGIWGGIENIPLDINRPGAAIGAQRVAITFFRDGRVLMRQPPEGLASELSETGASNWQSDWGRYEVRNGREVRISLPGGLVSGCWNGQHLRIKRGARTGVYRPWPRLSGALDGSYTVDPASPAISFSPNGAFTDAGFQQYLGDLQSVDGGVRFSGSAEERAARAPGRGRYSLRDNTLELRYSDGRVARFTAMATPEDAGASPLPRLLIANRFHDRTSGSTGGRIEEPPAAPSTPTASGRCALAEPAIRSSRAADGIYFSRLADGGVAAITLIGNGVLLDGRPPYGGLDDERVVAARIAERRRAAPVEVQAWAPAGASGVVLCGSGGAIHELKIEQGGARLSGAFGIYHRAPDPANARLDGVVWQALDVRDRFTGIEFAADGRFKESNVTSYLELERSRNTDRTGRWRMAGRYTLELMYDDTGTTERITALMDPFENPSARKTLYLNQRPFSAKSNR